MGAPEEQYYAELVRAIQDLPPNHIVTWGDDHARLADHVWRSSWIDVRPRELCDKLGSGWTWTVLTPDDGDAPEAGQVSTTIVLAPDVDVHTTWNETTHWYDTDGKVFLTSPGEPLGEAEREVLASQGTHVVAAGWTREAVNRALHEWCSVHAGRNDLVFVHDDSLVSPSMEVVQGLLADVENGAPTYQVGEGVFATAEVMDALLEMPAEDSAKAMKVITRVARASDGHGHAMD